MNKRLFLAFPLVMLVPVFAFAQTSRVTPVANGEAAAKKWTMPRTPWGEPDLQGTYSNRTITPFERPANVAGREFFTAEEVAALEKRAQEQTGDEGRSKGTRGDVERAYNDFWWDRGTKVTTPRTSLVIDPSDGRVPALTEEAKLRAANEAKRPAFRGTGANGRGTDSWLDRSTFERCITRGMPGAMSPTAYNNNYRITQSPGYVAIQIEMLGGARVIPTDGRPHVNQSIRQWMGNSVARWEGDTLVVDTTNFTDKVLYRGAAENLHLVERFTRVAPGQIDYRVTITDPTTFTKPWTLAIPYRSEALYGGAAENLHLVERFTRVAPGQIDYRVTITDPTTFTKPWTLAIPY